MNSAGDKWLCCGRFRKSLFCPDCGKPQPGNAIATDATRLADEFSAEATKYYKTAATYANKAESIRIEHHDDEVRYYGEERGNGNRTWGDEAYAAEQSGIAARSRADKFARYSRIIRELIDSNAEESLKEVRVDHQDGKR